MESLFFAIENLYGLKKLSHHEKVERGALSENHILKSDETLYFLKKYRQPEARRIAEIHSAKHYFSAGGIPVILPYPTKNGETFFKHENSYYALFPFIEGIHIERGSFTPHTARELGKMLGKIHTLGKASTLPISLSTFNSWNSEKVLPVIAELKTTIESLSSKTEFDEYALKSVLLKERLIKENTLSFTDLSLSGDTLMHGDYLDHNVFFDEDNTLTHVFDWEKTEYAPRTHELWRCLTYSFIEARNPSVELSLAAEFLAAYKKESPIDETELKNGFLLFYLKTIHTIWVETEHYKKNNTRPDHFLIPGFKRLLWITENREKLVELILQY